MDLHADFLIIGSGIAGLRAAVELSGAGSVLILTKADPRDGNTGNAQGGIAAAVGPDDSPALHAADTFAAGDGLCDTRAVEVLVGEGPRDVRELMDWAPRSTTTPTATSRWRWKARIAPVASCTHTTRLAGRSAACCGGARRRCRA